MTYASSIIWCFTTTILLQYCLLTYGHDSQILSDYTYIEKTKSFYKFHKTSQNGSLSITTCESEGAQLFYPEDETEAVEVTSALNIWHSPEYAIFIGIVQENGNFKTVDGRPISEVYTRWQSGEPYVYQNGNGCTLLYYDLSLETAHCSVWWSFICKFKPKLTDASEIKTTKQEENKQPDIMLSGYTYVKTTKSFYKYHNKKDEWRNAVSTCESEGGQLFYPEDETEAKEITSILNVWNGPTFAVYIGISRNHDHDNDFETVDGRNISEVYNRWSTAEPSSGSHLSCVTLYYDKLLTTKLCSNERPYICKITPSKVLQNDLKAEKEPENLCQG